MFGKIDFSLNVCSLRQSPPHGCSSAKWLDKHTLNGWCRFPSLHEEVAWNVRLVSTCGKTLHLLGTSCHMEHHWEDLAWFGLVWDGFWWLDCQEYRQHQFFFLNWGMCVKWNQAKTSCPCVGIHRFTWLKTKKQHYKDWFGWNITNIIHILYIFLWIKNYVS